MQRHYGGGAFRFKTYNRGCLRRNRTDGARHDQTGDKCFHAAQYSKTHPHRQSPPNQVGNRLRSCALRRMPLFPGAHPSYSVIPRATPFCGGCKASITLASISRKIIPLYFISPSPSPARSCAMRFNISDDSRVGGFSPGI